VAWGERFCRPDWIGRGLEVGKRGSARRGSGGAERGRACREGAAPRAAEGGRIGEGPGLVIPCREMGNTAHPMRAVTFHIYSHIDLEYK
jgi:hypothetical protein